MEILAFWCFVAAAILVIVWIHIAGERKDKRKRDEKYLKMLYLRDRIIKADERHAVNKEAFARLRGLAKRPEPEKPWKGEEGGYYAIHLLSRFSPRRLGTLMTGMMWDRVVIELDNPLQVKAAIEVLEEEIAMWKRFTEAAGITFCVYQGDTELQLEGLRQHTIPN